MNSESANSTSPLDTPPSQQQSRVQGLGVYARGNIKGSAYSKYISIIQLLLSAGSNQQPHVTLGEGKVEAGKNQQY